ncbi:MAG: pyrimidine 5'-nucleotidase [Anaerolineaceae bacterium]|nr:pyrimidine 5'-nucleotidase [Anaerolineaceae bacterium]
MCFETLFFDLDDTLYPPTSGLWDAIGERIETFMREYVHIPAAEVHDLRTELFLQYGSTMKGLVKLYGIKEQDFLDYVHDVPLTRFIFPNPDLRQTLMKYPQRKVIFTNADTNHANRVLNAIGLQGIFEQIIDIRAIHPFCKPQVEAFTAAMQLAGIQDPQNCVMIDDSANNLRAARQAGLFTIQTGVESCPEGIDAAVLTVLDLPDVIPTPE